MESVEELIKKYDRYIIVLATKFNINDLKEDLIQEGKIAIFNSYSNYDETKGTLHSYLVTSIRNAMITYVNTYGSTIKRPKQLVKEHININFISTSTPLGNDTDTTVGDTITVIEEDISIDDNQHYQYKAILMHFNELKPTQRYIVSNYLGLDAYSDKKTFDEIAKELNTSKQNIQQKYQVAIAKLKKFYLNNNNN